MTPWCPHSLAASRQVLLLQRHRGSERPSELPKASQLGSRGAGPPSPRACALCARSRARGEGWEDSERGQGGLALGASIRAGMALCWGAGQLGQGAPRVPGPG